MPGLEWAFKLRDQVTQPAGSMEAQLKRVAFALKALDLATKTARLDKITDPLKKTRLELQLHRDKLLLSKRAIDDHGRSSKSWTDSIVRWAGTLYIFDLVARGLRAVGRAAADMGSQIKDAVETQQRGLFGLRANLGNRAGTDLFSQLQQQAQVYGRPVGETVGMGQQFLQTGASPQAVRTWVAAVADVRARSGAQAAGQFQGAVQDMLNSPIFTMGNLQSFGNVFGQRRMFQAFAKEMHVGVGDVEPLLNLHGMPGQQAQDIMQRFMAGLPGAGGTIGGTAQRFGANTFEGSIGRVQTAWEKFLASVENSQGLKTLQSVLQNLARTLGGDEMRGALRDLADTLGEALKPLTGAAGRQMMETFFTNLTAAVKSVLPLLELAAKYTNILISYAAGKSAPGAPQSVGQELSQLGDYAGSAMDWILNRNGRGNGQPAYLRSPYQQLSQPVIHLNVDARGNSTRLDPEGFRRAIQHEIARQQRDAGPTEVNDAFEQLGVQSGAQ